MLSLRTGHVNQEAVPFGSEEGHASRGEASHGSCVLE